MEKRPDLAKLEVNAPENYLAHKVLPPVKVFQKSGTVYFRDIVSDGAAQTNRTQGDAPSETLIAESSDSFTCTEIMKRYKASYESVNTQYNGDVERALVVSAKAAKRSVLRKLEQVVADLILTSVTNAALDATDENFLEVLETAKQNVRRAEGKTVLVVGSDAFYNIMDLTEVKDAITSTNSGVSPAQRYLPETLAALLKIDAVLVGDLAHWGASGTSDYSKSAVLMKLPNPAEENLVLEAQVGRTLLYYVDGGEGEASMFDVEIFSDDNDRAHKVDAICWADPELYNPEGIQVIENIGETAS